MKRQVFKGFDLGRLSLFQSLGGYLPPCFGCCWGGVIGQDDDRDLYLVSREMDAARTPLSEAEFEEIMNRNRAISSSAISRAVSDASAGTTHTHTLTHTHSSSHTLSSSLTHSRVLLCSHFLIFVAVHKHVHKDATCCVP